MTFANVSVNKQQLALLSQLLLTAFPGCTIHQSRDPMRTIQHVSSGKIDAVFADADTCADLISILRKQKLNTTVYLMCQQEVLPLDETGDIHGIVTYPITKQKIQLALQNIPRKVREVV